MNISNGAADAAAPEQRFEITMTLNEQDFAQFMRNARALPLERVISIMPCVLLGLIGGLIGVVGWYWLARHYSSLRFPGGEILAVSLVVGALLLLWLRVIVPSYIHGMFRGQPVGMGDVRLVADEKEIVTDAAGAGRPGRGAATNTR